MRLSQAAGQLDADRAARDVDRTRRQRLNDPALAKRRAFDGVVVGQHGDDSLPATGAGHMPGRRRAEGDQGRCLVRAAIVDHEFMPGLDQVRRHAGAHAPQADES